MKNLIKRIIDIISGIFNVLKVDRKKLEVAISLMLKSNSMIRPSRRAGIILDT